MDDYLTWLSPRQDFKEYFCSRKFQNLYEYFVLYCGKILERCSFKYYALKNYGVCGSQSTVEGDYSLLECYVSSTDIHRNVGEA
jgi:hypothetical protein